MMTMMMMVCYVAGGDEIAAPPRSGRAVRGPATGLGVEGPRGRLHPARTSDWRFVSNRSRHERRDARTFHSGRRRTDPGTDVGPTDWPTDSSFPDCCAAAVHTWTRFTTRRAVRTCAAPDLEWPLSYAGRTIHTSCDRNSIECVAIRSSIFRFSFLLRTFHIASCIIVRFLRRGWCVDAACTCAARTVVISLCRALSRKLGAIAGLLPLLLHRC